MPELVVKLKGRELQRVPVATVVTRIGRDRANEVCIDNIGVSRLHCTIKLEGATFIAYDEDSSNGLFVNGQEVLARELRDGDVIQLGKYTVTWSGDGGRPLPQLAANRVTEDIRAGGARHRNPLETANISISEMGELLENRLQEEESTAGLDDDTSRQHMVGTRRRRSAVATAPRRLTTAPEPERGRGPVVALTVTVITLLGVIAFLLLTR